MKVLKTGHRVGSTVAFSERTTAADRIADNKTHSANRPEGASSSSLHPDPTTRWSRARMVGRSPGCIREAVVRLAAEKRLRLEERQVSVAEARAAKAVFKTNCGVFVQPVVSIDGKSITDGKPGPW